MEDIIIKMVYSYVKKIMKISIYQFVIDVTKKLNQLVMLKKLFVLVIKNTMLNVSAVNIIIKFIK